MKLPDGLSTAEAFAHGSRINTLRDHLVIEKHNVTAVLFMERTPMAPGSRKHRIALTVG